MILSLRFILVSFGETMGKSVLCLYVLIALCAFVASDSTTKAPTVEEECNKLNDECGPCVKHPKCLWCNKPPTGSKKCTAYPAGNLFPKNDVCPLADARWGVCWLNYKALLICMGIIAGIIVLSVTSCCVYCCCCRNKAGRQRRYQAEDARIEQERTERDTRNAERRAERQNKYDEIRRKYGIGQYISDSGITKEDGYQRFDNE